MIAAPTLAATAASPRSAYRPDVDGLRAMAAIAVVAYHAGFLPGGSLGVDTFFVISGFLISKIILRQLNTGDFSFLDFYARRVKRIFPALIAVLSLTLISSFLLVPKAQYAWLASDMAAASFFVHNIQLYLTIDARDATSESLLNHFWTLGVEEQFYLLWPAFLWLAYKAGKSPLAWILGLTTASLILDYMTTSRDPAATLLLSNRLWELSLGGALAQVQLRRVAEIRLGKTRYALTAPLLHSAVGKHLLGLLGAALLIVAFSGIGQPHGWPVYACLIGTVFVIFSGPQSLIGRYVLSARALVFTGLLSYPLYLWHWPLLIMAAMLEGQTHIANYQQIPITTRISTIIIAYLLAYLTYRHIESPIRLSPHPHGSVRLLCFIMALVGGGGYLALNLSA